MIRLRAAEPADEWTFWSLRREIQPSLTRAEHLLWWEQSEYRWLAYDGPATVGVIRISGWTGGEVPYYAPATGLVHLQVARKEQGKGFGPAMLTALRQLAKARGFTRLEARVAIDNHASHVAFERAEWIPTRWEVAL